MWFIFLSLSRWSKSFYKLHVFSFYKWYPIARRQNLISVRNRIPNIRLGRILRLMSYLNIKGSWREIKTFKFNNASFIFLAGYQISGRLSARIPKFWLARILNMISNLIQNIKKVGYPFHPYCPEIKIEFVFWLVFVCLRCCGPLYWRLSGNWISST